MKIGTANIKNFPDMPPANVAADARKMSAVTDVWGQQENDPREDDPVITRTLGPSWGIVHGGTNVPVYFKKDVLQVQGARVKTVPFSPTLPLTPRPRIMTGTTFVLRQRPGVPAFVIINVHFIAGAYNGPEEPRRIRQWDIEWPALKSFVADYKRKGHTVFVLGDFNHPRPPKPTTNFTWLVGARLDRIGVTRTGGVEVEELSSGDVELNSDHNGQWSRVTLSRLDRA